MSGLASVILVIHALVTIAMIGVILLQRSEGGALGVGGGSNSFLSARSAGNVLTRTTTILVIVFFATSLALTVLSRHTGPRSLQFGAPAPSGKVAAPQSLPVTPPAQPPSNSNAPANPMGDIPGFGTPKTSSPAGGAPAPAQGGSAPAPGTPGKTP